MRTFTVVPSFDGDSAFFELPDIGFQGDNLSFAILFNLTELTEHWPDIVPSMIVTDPENNTFIAPHVSWNPVNHIFTWYISEIETAYKGVVRCQLKCTKQEDPDTIVCMSRICQTRVYESLAAASDPPEAFQTWIDTLVQLGAEINANASAVMESVEATQTNASTAQAAADDAEAYKNAAAQASTTASQAAQTASEAQESASQSQQKATSAASAAETAKTAAETAQAAVEEALETIDAEVLAARQAASSAADSASEAAESRSGANSAKLAAESARDAAAQARIDAGAAADAAIGAQTAAETAQAAAETAQTGAETAKDAAQTAQSEAESAQSAAETAQAASEAARDTSEDYADKAKRWAIGVNAAGDAVDSTDPTFENNSKYWAEQSSGYAEEANNAKDIILQANVSTVRYSGEDESVTVYLGGNTVVANSQDGGSGEISEDVVQALNEHIADDSRHVTVADRTRWNGKLNYRMEGETLIFTNK